MKPRFGMEARAYFKFARAKRQSFIMSAFDAFESMHPHRYGGHKDNRNWKRYRINQYKL